VLIKGVQNSKINYILQKVKLMTFNLRD